jgi:hypothetical protein
VSSTNSLLSSVLAGLAKNPVITRAGSWAMLRGDIAPNIMVINKVKILWRIIADLFFPVSAKDVTATSSQHDHRIK